MRDRFSVTITDIYGARHFYLHRAFKTGLKFTLILLFFLIACNAGLIWFLHHRAIVMESRRIQTENRLTQVLSSRQVANRDFARKQLALEEKLDDRNRQVKFLDQTLQGWEDMIGITPGVGAVVEDRVKMVQQTFSEKQIMLTNLPNGRPVKIFKGVSSGYGRRKHPFTGKKEFHRGIDYPGSKGDAVVATADSVVVFAGYSKESGFGNLVILSHTFGFKSLYGHLNRIDVKAGQSVGKGELIGGIGSTGTSSGFHLHYEVSFVRKQLNPRFFVEWNLKTYNQLFDNVKGVPWVSLGQKVSHQVSRVEKQLLLKGVTLAEK